MAKKEKNPLYLNKILLFFVETMKGVGATELALFGNHIIEHA